MVSGTFPEEVSVIDWVVAVFSGTVPNTRLVELRLNAGVAAFNCSDVVFVTPAALAVMVTVRAVVTADAAAVNPAVVAPLATVTDAGTVSALLLLERITVRPPLAAAAVRLTVQASVPAPLNVV
jgi:hypothetical protein